MLTAYDFCKNNCVFYGCFISSGDSHDACYSKKQQSQYRKERVCSLSCSLVSLLRQALRAEKSVCGDAEDEIHDESTDDNRCPEVF